MHFIYAEWLRHGRPNEATSIFGIDIQPHGTRLATCGQDCAVKLWHLPLLASLAQGKANASQTASHHKSNDKPTNFTSHPLGQQQEQPQNQQLHQQPPQPQQSPQQHAISGSTPPPGALLATIRSHTAAVNVVRWSPNGTLLASAGDDHVVLIYHRAKTSAPMFGELPSAEAWLVRRPLRAHSSDVTDLAWSPDAERLASASVDNTIVVWNVQSDAPLVRLDGHVGLVKGLAWDPVGRFLASQSDDRTVRVWRTTDWKTEKVLSDPFQSAVFEENSMSFFLRISWSPCGSHLVAVNAHRKPATQYAPMFSRQTDFSDPVEFIGHREPVISARFSPCLYRRQKKKSDVPAATQSPAPRSPNGSEDENSESLSSTYTVLALGSKDGGCSVWRASGARPFFEMYDAFEMEVIDIAWGSDGHTMVACSTDGRVLYVRFTPAELGVVVPPDEARVILTDLWRSFGAGSINAAAPLPESAVQLQMEAANNQPAVNSSMADVAVSNPNLPASAPKASPPAAASNSQSLTQVPGPVITAAETARQNGPTPPADPRVMAAQAETRVRGGKRRIVPMAIPTDGESPFDGNTSRPSVGPQSLADAGASESAAVSIPLITASQPMVIETLDTDPTPSPAKRPRTALIDKDNVVNGGSTTGNNINGDPATNGTTLREERLAMAAIPKNAARVTHASELHAPSVVGLSLMILPDSNGEGRGRCRVIGRGDASVMLESHELGTEAGGFIVTCSSGGKVKWRDYHAKGYTITALAGIADKFAAVGTWDGALFLYSASSGRRLTPPIVMDSAPYMLEAYAFPDQHASTNSLEADVTAKEKWYVVVITRSALCSVFDVKEKRMVCARSAAWLLARAANVDNGGKVNGESGGTPKVKFVREVSHCEVTPYGEPILMLSDGHSFVYSRDLCAWVRVADDSLPNSEFRRTVKESDKVGLLRLLQSGSGRRQRGVGTLSGMGDLRRAAVESLAHLESLMESAIVVGSPEDYRYYLTNYAARIAAAVNDDVESCTLRLREVCDHLLNVECPQSDRKIVGMSGRMLLRDVVLPIISENRAMQRIVAEYVECLSQLDNLIRQRSEV